MARAGATTKILYPYLLDTTGAGSSEIQADFDNGSLALGSRIHTATYVDGTTTGQSVWELVATGTGSGTTVSFTGFDVQAAVIHEDAESALTTPPTTIDQTAIIGSTVFESYVVGASGVYRWRERPVLETTAADLSGVEAALVALSPSAWQYAAITVTSPAVVEYYQWQDTINGMDWVQVDSVHGWAGTVAQTTPGQAVLSRFYDDYLGSTLADGATAEWTSTKSVNEFLLGGTAGDDGADEPTVASGVITFTGVTEYIQGTTAMRPPLNTTDPWTFFAILTADDTGDGTQVVVGLADGISGTPQGISLFYVTAANVWRLRIGDSVTGVTSNVAATAATSTLVVGRVMSTRGVDGLRLDAFTVAGSPITDRDNTTAVVDATPADGPRLGRVATGNTSNFEGTMTRFAMTSEELTDADVLVLATELGFSII